MKDTKHLEIHIVNWEKYNPRKDLKSMPWLRVESNLWFQPDFQMLEKDAKYLWFFILCMGGFMNSAVFQLDLSYIATHTTLSKVNIIKLLELLETNGFVRLTNGFVPNVTERNVTKRNETITLDFDFDAVYRGYPRKQGKKRAFLVLERTIKKKEQYDRLKTAVDNYRLHCENEGTEKKYIKHFSTFVNEWEDWADIDPPEVAKSLEEIKQEWLEEEGRGKNA